MSIYILKDNYTFIFYLRFIIVRLYYNDYPINTASEYSSTPADEFG